MKILLSVVLFLSITSLVLSAPAPFEKPVRYQVKVPRAAIMHWGTARWFVKLKPCGTYECRNEANGPMSFNGTWSYSHGTGIFSIKEGSSHYEASTKTLYSIHIDKKHRWAGLIRGIDGRECRPMLFRLEEIPLVE